MCGVFVMACDICGTTGLPLEALRKDYQTKTIKDICSSCATKVNSELTRQRSLYYLQQEIFLKAYMCGLRVKK